MLPGSVVVSLLCSLAEAQHLGNRKLGEPHSDKLPALSIVLGIASAVVVVIILLLAAIAFLKIRFFSSPSGTSVSRSLVSSPVVSQPAEFSLKELLSVTSGFSDRIGTGLLGSVYKGVLPGSSTPVAVKRLNSFTGTDREFRSSVSRLISVSHPALVKLLGFCCDGACKALVYEFLPHGSLDKLLFESSGEVGWEFRLAAALAIAGGVEYLHLQQMPVIHGNIKSENVLLDEGFKPKLCDAGLSSLVDRRRLKAGLGEGVHGYLSPEMASGGEVTTKSDVYGFGMVLLEMIGGRRVMDLSRRSEEWDLVEWARKEVKMGKYAEIVDPMARLESDDVNKVVNAIDVALCCIQRDSIARPSMSKVVEMLQSSI